MVYFLKRVFSENMRWYIFWDSRRCGIWTELAYGDVHLFTVKFVGNALKIENGKMEMQSDYSAIMQTISTIHTVHASVEPMQIRRRGETPFRQSAVNFSGSAPTRQFNLDIHKDFGEADTISTIRRTI